MKTIFKFLGLCLLLGLAYLFLWPVPITPQAWVAPKAPGYQGPHAVNDKLAHLQIIDLHGEVGPEHIAIGPDG
ncbi:MAG: SMP-30/gluconolactonase/LRE family protein, partial [Betaproteobacteria bacterium]|nr:SMP-30/gluconolactonase/LRE family protein [Betaproteobacteria bacterium]